MPTDTLQNIGLFLCWVIFSITVLAVVFLIYVIHQDNKKLKRREDSYPKAGEPKRKNLHKIEMDLTENFYHSEWK